MSPNNSRIRPLNAFPPNSLPLPRVRLQRRVVRGRPSGDRRGKGRQWEKAETLKWGGGAKPKPEVEDEAEAEQKRQRQREKLGTEEDAVEALAEVGGGRIGE